MITESTIVSISNQPDERRYVTERHVNDDGNEIIIEYLADKNFDVNKMLHTRSIQLNEQLEKEYQDSLAAEKSKVVLQKHDEAIESLSIDDTKNTFSLNDEEAVLLKTLF